MSDIFKKSDPDILESQTRELQPHVDKAQNRAETAQARLNDHLLIRLFPSEATRLAAANELVELRAGFEYRQRALGLAVEMKIKEIEEACNNVLITGRGQVRRERQEFFAGQFQLLQEAMNRRAEEFTTSMERQFQRLEAVKNERLRNKEEERLERAVDRFHEVIESMTEDFASIIHEGVSG